MEREKLHPILDSHFCGLESLDVNFGRDVVLDLAPVRDDQVSGQTSSRIQCVSDEFVWNRLCTKLMMTTFVHRSDWIKTNCSTNTVHLDRPMECQILFHTMTICLPVCLLSSANNRRILRTGSFLDCTDWFSAIPSVSHRYGIDLFFLIWRHERLAICSWFLAHFCSSNESNKNKRSRTLRLRNDAENESRLLDCELYDPPFLHNHFYGG